MASHFFTANLADCESRLLVDRVEVLRTTVREVRTTHPFEIAAWVVIPEQLHAVWRLSREGAGDSMRRGLIKSQFPRLIPTGE